MEEAAYKAALFFNAQIESVNEYLESRGINRELANKFLLGFAPSGYTKEIGIKEETQRKKDLIFYKLLNQAENLIKELIND